MRPKPKQTRFPGDIYASYRELTLRRKRQALRDMPWRPACYSSWPRKQHIQSPAWASFRK
jgi:hypothetical protein